MVQNGPELTLADLVNRNASIPTQFPNRMVPGAVIDRCEKVPSDRSRTLDYHTAFLSLICFLMTR